MLQDNDATVQNGALASALTLGRLISPVKLTQDQEIAYLKVILEFTSAFFSEGEA